MASPFRDGLFGEIVQMALGTLREQKMRSGLTVLGIVIGIMSIVGSTSLIRGLDQSLRESIEAMGSNTIVVAKFSGLSMGSGRELTELLRRPNLTPDDAEAIASQTSSLASVNITLGQGGPPDPRARLLPVRALEANQTSSGRRPTTPTCSTPTWPRAGSSHRARHAGERR